MRFEHKTISGGNFSGRFCNANQLEVVDVCACYVPSDLVAALCKLWWTVFGAMKEAVVMFLFPSSPVS
jgi:hypothetical protein